MTRRKQYTAADHLEAVRAVIGARGQQRDLPNGERTMARCVRVFNALTDHELSVVDGWLFMQVLKQCRMRAGKYTPDDYLDNTGYSALMAEAAAQEHMERKPTRVSESPHRGDPMTAHNHGIDPSCPEILQPDGTVKGACMFPPPDHQGDKRK